jgi:hypothetical protein
MRMDGSLATVISVALGIGLAAATGFRVFLPLLVAALAARYGALPLNDSFAWLQSTPALFTLASAAVLETLAYYIPGVDHALDLVAGPATVVAGIVASASVMTDVPPAIMWPVAIIAGGGIAGLTKGSTAVVRAKSAALTGGLANPVVSTVETVGATGIAVLAIAVPLLCIALIAALVYWSGKKAGRLLFGRRATRSDEPA